MPIKPTVAKEAVLDAPVDEVWDALTNADALTEWFGGSVALYPTPGGDVVFLGEDGERRSGFVEVADRPRRLVFWWWPDNSSRGAPGTCVEFTLDPTSEGTRLVLAEREGEPPAPPARAPVGFRRRG